MSGLNGISPELAQLESLYGSLKKEWRYEMRREAQEIVPGQFLILLEVLALNLGQTDSAFSRASVGLFVGPFQPSWKLEILQGLGITHILCIAESREALSFSFLLLSFLLSPVLTMSLGGISQSFSQS